MNNKGGNIISIVQKVTREKNKVIADLRQQLADSQAQVQTWISVEDRLPIPSEDWDVMLRDAEGDCLDIVRTSYGADGKARYYSTGDEYTVETIKKIFTHWMSIPALPAEETK